MYNNNTQSRKWFITINNPAEHEFDHSAIKAILAQMKSITYWCMGDEKGSCYHTHIYIQCKAPVRFGTLKRKFPPADIEEAKGSAKQSRDYIFKEEKYTADEKHHTNLPDTHEEWGEIPDEKPYTVNKGSMAELYEMIKSGLSNDEILNIYPQYLSLLDKINKCRQGYLNGKYKDIRRTLDVTYIWGVTGAGKTRSIYEKYEKYSDVYRITDYTHPFDNYEMQDVIVFDEFRSSLKLTAMLNYLDIYPLELPCRYYNKAAAYTKVCIVSNIDLREQYPDIQRYKPESWKAFLRRIHHVIVFDGSTKKEYSIEEYLKNI